MADGSTPLRGLRCACGWEARGTLDELMVAAMEHGRRIHNMIATPAQVEAMLIPLGPDGQTGRDHRAQPGDDAGHPA